MRLASLGLRNVMRSRFRTVMTIAGVAVAIIAFVMLRTVLSAWTTASEYAAKDRVVTRHKVSFIMSMPGKYLDEVRGLEGVKSAASSNWFGGKDPRNPNEFFATIAVEPKAFLEVYDEVSLEPSARDAWLTNRRGAIVGDVLAKKLGWKVGDRITLQGTIFSGDWEFEVSGIYRATRRSMDRTSLFFHYAYLNEWARQRMPPMADSIGWVTTRIERGARPAEMAVRIDRHFDDRDVQTMSQDERAFTASFLGMLTAVLQALDIVSVVILLIMMLILGNTIAMGVRERTHEYGVLRAMGFLPRHLALFVFGEAAAIGLLGGLVGLALSYPLVEGGMGRFLEENMGSMFPYFTIAPSTAVAAVVLSLLLGLLAAALPAYNASKLDVVSSLRSVG